MRADDGEPLPALTSKEFERLVLEWVAQQEPTWADQPGWLTRFDKWLADKGYRI